MGITQLEAGLEGDGGLSGCNYSCKGISNELLLDALERGLSERAVEARE